MQRRCLLPSRDTSMCVMPTRAIDFIVDGSRLDRRGSVPNLASDRRIQREARRRTPILDHTRSPQSRIL
jgi:hypothetical protein